MFLKNHFTTMANITDSNSISFTIKSGGNAIPDYFNILSVVTEKRINDISVARITVLDGDPATGTFPASSSTFFVPGVEITIEAGYDLNSAVIFKGIVTGQSLRIDASVGSALEVEFQDVAVKMTAGRKSKIYSEMKDSEVISALINSYPGLSAHVTATSSHTKELVQYYTSDWDYMLSLAESNGMLVAVSDSFITIAPPESSTATVMNARYGDNLIEFHADLNAKNQVAAVTASSWNYKTQSVISGEAKTSLTGPGNLSTKKLAQVSGLEDFKLQATAGLETDDLAALAKAQMLRSEYSKIRGSATIQGTSLVIPGNYITFSGLGDRFNGDYLVSGVIHELSEGNWITKLSLGLPPRWLTAEPGISEPPISGVLPVAKGLINGTVKQIAEDPESQYRILINLPLIDPHGAGVWARLAGFYASSRGGSFFLPEIGDEVVIGFFNDDPRCPVILGSMYSSINKKPSPSLTPKDNNPLKAIVSRSGISVQFDDEKNIITIETPAKNTIILSDADKKISILDENANTIVMSSEGISLNSSKNIVISADQKLILKGQQGVEVSSSAGDIQVQGMNIKQSANMQYSAQGGQTAQVSAGMELTLKGAMVMIN